MESWKDLAAGKITAEKLAKKTVSRYKDDKDAGTLAVIQWIVDACSCKCIVQTIESIPDLPKQMEIDVFIDHEGFPVLENKMISAKFCKLMKLLIKKCEHSVLYDEFLMHILCDLLCKLSISEIRGFRHVCTLAGLSIASELADLCHNIEKQRNNLNKQLYAEKDLTVEREVSWQESLTTSVGELSENLHEASRLMQLLVEEIFKHRIRDVSSKIRLFCCESLNSWLEKYPEIFVNDEYLEIVHILLYDPVKSVRMYSLKIVELLISTGEQRQNTRKFLSNSKAKLIAMTLDISCDIAVQAVRVLALVDKFFQPLLDPKDKEQIYLMLFSMHKPVAQEAAAYVLQVSREIMEDDGSHILENIATFFKECNFPDHAAVFVDSLWGICKELCDWREIVECFLQQKVTDIKYAFSKIMVCCIHRAVTGDTPRNKGQNKFQQPVMTVERSKCKMREQERKEITEVFMVYLPEIIKQNKEEEKVLIEILKIPLYLQTEVYGSTINQKALEALLDTLREVLLFTNDDRVLDSIAEIYRLYNSPELATSNTTVVKCGMLMVTIVDVTKTAMEIFHRTVQESMPPVDVTYEIEKWVKKLSGLSKCIDIRSYDIFNEMLQFIAADVEGRFPVPDEIMCYMLQSCFHGLKMKVGKSAEIDKNSNSFKNLMEDLQTFIQLLTAHLASDSKTSAQKEAFNIFCELVYFLHVICRSYPNLTEFMYKPDGYVEDRLICILNEWVFIVTDPLEESQTETTLDEREKMLRSYWKLLCCWALPMRNADFIFKRYTEFPELEDCLREMFEALLKYNSELCAEILVRALSSEFHILQERTSPASLKSLKERVRKFAAVFEENSSECRVAVVAVQKRAIYHIGQLENWSQSLNFLDFFTDFARMTHVSDVDNIIKYLKENIPVGERHHTRESVPFKQYIKCLLEVMEST